MSSSAPPTKTCPRCQMAVPVKAYVCAYCKKRLRTGPVAMGCLVLVLIGAVGAIGNAILSSRSSESPQPATPPRIQTILAGPPQASSPFGVHPQPRRLEEDAQFLKTKAGKIWAKHTEWSRADCEMIAARHINIGMTAEQVRTSWGRPERVNSTMNASGRSEQWVYAVGQYVYFNNGIMTSLQQSR